MSLNFYFRQNLIKKNYNTPKPVIFLTFKEEPEIKEPEYINPYDQKNFPIPNQKVNQLTIKPENFFNEDSSFAESEKFFVKKNPQKQQNQQNNSHQD